MRPLKIASLFLPLFISMNSIAQGFEPPKGYQFNSKEDYALYEKDIIQSAKWLKETPLNSEREKRKEVSAFIVAWCSGSPNVDVELVPSILDFEEKNSGMMIIYMASSAKYVLENNYSKDMRAKHKAALLDMIEVYKAGNGIKKDKKMEKLIKANDDGKIEEWIENNMKVNK